MVRHGRAAAGWDVDPDPGLDDLGRAQALEAARALSGRGATGLVTSPLLRCRQTAFPLETATGMEARIDRRVAEIPSPAHHTMATRVDWLREAMAGTWDELVERSGGVYEDYRAGVVDAVRSVEGDTVIFSHFVAINAAIGHALGDRRFVVASVDNCSITVFETDGETLVLRETGRQADTLVR
jgi:broad specificity phosphatase PhoE